MRLNYFTINPVNIILVDFLSNGCYLIILSECVFSEVSALCVFIERTLNYSHTYHELLDSPIFFPDHSMHKKTLLQIIKSND